MTRKGFKGLILLLAIPAILSAQEDQEKEKVRSIIRAFTQDISHLFSEGRKKADEIMNYTAPNFTYTNRTINITNVVTVENMSKEKVAFMLNQFRQSGITAKRTLGNLDEVYVRRNLALARYTVDYETYESDRMINRGRQWVSMLLRKNSSDEWKIETLEVLNADDVTFKSLCICEIYENKGLSDIFVETIVPDGHEVDIMEDKFSIDSSVEPRQVRHGFKDYLWSTSGAIHRRNPDGSQGVQVGKAASRQELLLTLIQKEVYPDRCTTTIRKLK